MLNKKLKKGILIFTLIALVFFVLPANIFGVDGVGVEVAAAKETTTEDEGDTVAGFLSWVTLGIASACGKVLTAVIWIVNELFAFQEFETNGVKTGWVIVRDLCNMFFILVLLMIAFATILRLENYSMKKYLPKLLIMAVLINFSKTICLFLIDISQIVMLTFSNAFTGASGNFVTMLNIDKMFALSEAADFGDITWEIFYAVFLALLFMIIAFFIMIMMMGILIMRVIIFWVLIILAPLAFLSTAVPGGGKYWTQWWGEFTKYLIAGPVLAFFTWLALLVASDNPFKSLDPDIIKSGVAAKAAISKIGKGENVMHFVLAIGLLIGAMKITMSLGAMGASFGANLANKAKMKGVSLGKKGVSGAAKFTGRTGLAGVSGSSWAVNKMLKNKDAKGNVKRGMMGQLATNWRNDLVTTNRKNKKKKRLETLKKMGMSSEETFAGVEELANSKRGRAVKGVVGTAGVLTGNPAAIAAGGAMMTTFMGGILKNWSDSRKNKRETSKEDVRAEKEKTDDKLLKDRNKELEVIELKNNFDPSDRIKESEKILKADVDRIDVKKADEIKSLFSQRLSAPEYLKREKEINKQYDDEKDRFRTNHEERVKDAKGARINDDDAGKMREEVQERYQETKAKLDARFNDNLNSIEKSKNFFDKGMEKYQPNRVTVEAAQAGNKEMRVSKELVKALKNGADVSDFEANKFYSSSGITSAQKRLFTELSAGTDATKEAIEKMTKTFTEIAMKGEKAKNKELLVVKSIKQGLAAYKKSGNNIGAFEPIINVVNTIPNHQDIDHKDRDKTVADFESSVIGNK
ncbi:MAG: hypothetical protein U9M94_01365 [Patescibacteria group bacterium]|nr:hypothetical protein [Patescibacteria group bacterium]